MGRRLAVMRARRQVEMGVRMQMERARTMEGRGVGEGLSEVDSARFLVVMRRVAVKKGMVRAAAGWRMWRRISA